MIRDVVVGGVRWHVRVRGEGPPILLLHGFTGAGESWDDVIRELEHEYLCVVVDLVGHGRTDAPRQVEYYQMESVATSLLSIMASLGHSQFATLGYSMGGRLALYIACHWPQHIDSLILESASPGLATEGERLERCKSDERLACTVVQTGTEAFIDQWEKLPLFATQRNLSENVLRRQREIRVSHSAEGLANSLRGMGTGVQPSLWEKIDSVQAPTLLITGEYDTKFCGIATKMADRMPHTKHVTVSESGHTVHLEQPSVYVRIVRTFLANQGGTRGGKD